LPIIMALFWLALYVFVNLTSIIWLGSIAVNKVAGVNQNVALVILGAFALLYQLRGGLKAVALTDIVQVTLLVLGGLVVAFLMLVIIVLPGIAAVVLAPTLVKPDEAYPTMMRLLPPGLLGLVFAALVAAIIASTASKINSIATIFTLDLYAKFRGERTRAED